jgi:hypothetical protein
MELLKKKCCCSVSGCPILCSSGQCTTQRTFSVSIEMQFSGDPNFYVLQASGTFFCSACPPFGSETYAISHCAAFPNHDIEVDFDYPDCPPYIDLSSVIATLTCVTIEEVDYWSFGLSSIIFYTVNFDDDCEPATLDLGGNILRNGTACPTPGIYNQFVTVQPPLNVTVTDHNITIT